MLDCQFILTKSFLFTNRRRSVNNKIKSGGAEMKSNQKKDILNKARILIEQKGYETFRLEDLLQELNLSKGGFYHYFKSVEALLTSLIEEDFSKEIKEIQGLKNISSTKEAMIKLFRVGVANSEGGILKSINTNKSRLLYLNLMDDIWYQPIKKELHLLLQRGVENKEFPEMNITVVCELFEAINRHSNRFEILRQWSDELAMEYALMSIDILASQLKMQDEFSKLKSKWRQNG